MLQPWKDRSADKLQSSPGTSELPLEQSTGLLVSPTLATSVVRALYARDWRVEQVHSRAVLPRPDHALIPVLHLEARLHPREGDERLSGSQKGETRGAGWMSDYYASLVGSYRAALEGGYRWHEFGDSHLILGS